jgi:hypothetical protein
MTGHERGRVWSKERKPSLLTDLLSDRVFIKAEDKLLIAYQFAPSETRKRAQAPVSDATFRVSLTKTHPS